MTHNLSFSLNQLQSSYLLPNMGASLLCVFHIFSPHTCLGMVCNPSPTGAISWCFAMLVKKGRWPTRRQQDRADRALCCKAAHVCGQRLACSDVQNQRQRAALESPRADWEGSVTQPLQATVAQVPPCRTATQRGMHAGDPSASKERRIQARSTQSRLGRSKNTMAPGWPVACRQSTVSNGQSCIPDPALGEEGRLRTVND